MSKNRHCDIGDHDFSEQEEGWAELKVTFHNRYDDMSPNNVTESADACAEHADLFRPAGRETVRRGRRTLRELTVGSSSVKDDRIPSVNAQMAPSDTHRLVDQAEYDRYIEWMERQNGIGGYGYGGDGSHSASPSERSESLDNGWNGE